MMENKMIARVHPLERFNVRFNRKIRRGPGDVPFQKQARYYHCPVCSRKTKVKPGQLDAFNPIPSKFPEELQRLFDQVETSDHEKSFDFYCQSCKEPVRLLFWTQERGMGGWWYPYVISILELTKKD
ncbi:MAG: hypothetical protein ISR59_06750 [Anaerolineales bacterium]|nr:hypothetical protein [Anaerolineales bacterium]